MVAAEEVPAMPRKFEVPVQAAREKAARVEMGVRIAEARTARGLTQQQLADALGYADYQNVWLIEKGRMPIPADRVRRIEEVLGLEPYSLYLEECRLRLLRQGFDQLTLTPRQAGRKAKAGTFRCTIPTLAPPDSAPAAVGPALALLPGGRG